MNPLTPLELLDIIEREHGFESPSIRLALERAKKEHKLLELYRDFHYGNHDAETDHDICKQIKQLEEELK